MECTRQMYICRACHFSGQRLSREELGHTIKRGKVVCISVIVPLERSNFAYVARIESRLKMSLKTFVK